MDMSACSLRKPFRNVDLTHLRDFTHSTRVRNTILLARTHVALVTCPHSPIRTRLLPLARRCTRTRRRSAAPANSRPAPPPRVWIGSVLRLCEPVIGVAVSRTRSVWTTIAPQNRTYKYMRVNYDASLFQHRFPSAVAHRGQDRDR